MICSRTVGSRVSAYSRNQLSTRLTADSSPGRTSLTVGLDWALATGALPESVVHGGWEDESNLNHFYPCSPSAATAGLRLRAGPRTAATSRPGPWGAGAPGA